MSVARRKLNQKRIGHAGTLDPMATGLVILGVGTYTRFLTYLVGLDKEYEATIRLGGRSETDDADGEVQYGGVSTLLESVNSSKDHESVVQKEILHGISQLTGTISQVPSSVSAIKVDGKRAYQRVRDGEQVELKSRTVTIYEFEVLSTERVTVDSVQCIDVRVRVHCSSGTYIRSLARDLGQTLGTGGFLVELRRTAIGPIPVSDAVEDVETLSPKSLLPVGQVAEQLFRHAELTEEQYLIIKNGGMVSGQEVTLTGPTADERLRRRTRAGSEETLEDPIALTFHNDLIAIATQTSGKIKPLTVFQT